MEQNYDYYVDRRWTNEAILESMETTIVDVRYSGSVRRFCK